MALTVRINLALQILRFTRLTHARTCKFGPKETGMIHGLDFSYFCAVVIPFASASKLRLLCDWGNWVSSFNLPVYSSSLPKLQSKLVNILITDIPL